MISGDPSKFSDQENLQRCWGRAVEWSAWPAFIAQPVLPVLYLFYSWKWVLAALLAANLIWLVVRTPLANFELATAGCFFVKLKWPVILIVAAYSFYKGKNFIGALALLTPILVPLFSLFSTGHVGKFQRIFMEQIGYAYRQPEM